MNESSSLGFEALQAEGPDALLHGGGSSLEAQEDVLEVLALGRRDQPQVIALALSLIHI